MRRHRPGWTRWADAPPGDGRTVPAERGDALVRRQTARPLSRAAGNGRDSCSGVELLRRPRLTGVPRPFLGVPALCPGRGRVPAPAAGLPPGGAGAPLEERAGRQKKPRARSFSPEAKGAFSGGWDVSGTKLPAAGCVPPAWSTSQRAGASPADCWLSFMTKSIFRLIKWNCAEKGRLYLSSKKSPALARRAKKGTDGHEKVGQRQESE